MFVSYQPASQNPNKKIKEKQHSTSQMSHLYINYTATLFCNLQSKKEILE